MSTPSLKAGIEITCENGHVCGVVLRDLYMGDTGYVDAFHWCRNGPKVGDTINQLCSICNAEFIRVPIQVHTKDGWIPRFDAEGRTQ